MRKRLDDTTPEARLMLTARDAAKLLGIGETMMKKLLFALDPLTRKPKVASVKIGRLRRIPRKALDLYIEREMQQ